MDWNQFWTTVVGWLTTNGVKLLVGVIALFVLFAVINAIAKGVKKGMEKKNADKTIVKVTYWIIRKGLKLVLFVVFLGYVGIDTAGIGALIGSVGVGIGLALQGSLSNLAGGIIILIMRPFKVGDYIEAQDYGGTVEEIKIFYTYLTTPDNKVVMIPNGTLSNGSIVNFSTKEFRRVDFKFSISYAEDFERAKTVLMEICEANPLVRKDPAPFVRIGEHAESAMLLYTRVWTKKDDYWTVYYEMMETVKRRFDEEKIAIPYPQIDVHL